VMADGENQDGVAILVDAPLIRQRRSGSISRCPRTYCATSIVTRRPTDTRAPVFLLWRRSESWRLDSPADRPLAGSGRSVRQELRRSLKPLRNVFRNSETDRLRSRS
jgi:hypothetical protein